MARKKTETSKIKLPVMEFERIVDRCKGKKSFAVLRKEDELKEMDCPSCGKKMKYHYSGPRAASGKCTCGFYFMS